MFSFISQLWKGRSRQLVTNIYGSSYSGKAVNQDTALSLDAFWSCVRLISELIATLPVAVYKKEGRSRVVADDHRLHKLLTDVPNAEMSAVDFWSSVVASILLRGNAYILLHKSAGKKIYALEPLLPDRIRIFQGEGWVRYEYIDHFGQLNHYESSQILHIKGFTIDGRIGLSPLSYARHVLGAGLAQEEVAGGIFKNGLRPTGVISTEQILKPSQRDEIREYHQKLSSSSRDSSAMVLEAGFKYQAISMDPQDAQLLESRAFTVEQICRFMYNIPPVMIGHNPKGQTMWGTGVSETLTAWRVTGLNPLIVKIEKSFRSLFDASERSDYYIKFDLNALLRPDIVARSRLYSSAAQNGWMTRNEIRELEDLEPFDGGDMFTTQSNLTPVNKLGEVSE